MRTILKAWIYVSALLAFTCPLSAQSVSYNVGLCPQVACQAPIPATIVAVVHQLFCQHGGMLSRDSRHSTIERPRAQGPVTRGAGSKKLRASIQAWLGVQCIEQFLARGRCRIGPQ